MLFAEKESNIIDLFRILKTEEILLLPTGDRTEYICQSLLNTRRWEKWIDSSAKDAPPPDFYNDNEQIMMDVMRVDDHGFKKHGKIINPTYTREHQLEKELHDSGIIDFLPNLKSIIINADTGLPTEEDHNYKYYSTNFCRTVNDHKEKIQMYKQNHPGYITVFFVFDESSAYFEAEKKPTKIYFGGIVKARPHFWFEDRKFLDIFMNSSIDYMIWFTPYKMYENSTIPYKLPRAAVFDCKCSTLTLREYDAERMVSSEI